jgi:hypothetical protein
MPETKLSQQFSPEASKQFIQFENHLSNKYQVLSQMLYIQLNMYKIKYGHKIPVKCVEVWWNIKLYIYMQKVLEYSTNIQTYCKKVQKS